MNLRADLHTHTTHSDGESTVFELGKEAAERGIALLGISDHAYAEFPDGSGGFGIRGDELDAYINDVYTLRDMYTGTMNVLCGLEMENLSGFTWIDEFQDSQLDYLIGSTHNLVKDGIGFSVDHSEKRLLSAAENLFDGDFYALVRHYYEQEAKVAENTHCDIIGHFDLITKFNQDGRLFDESSDEYLEPALAAMDHLLETDLPFEINTGAISRGYRKEPYPSERLLRELFQRGGRIILNSDAHDRYFLEFHFEEALKLAYDCGFRKVSVIDFGGEQQIEF